MILRRGKRFISAKKHHYWPDHSAFYLMLRLRMSRVILPLIYKSSQHAQKITSLYLNNFHFRDCLGICTAGKNKKKDVRSFKSVIKV